jgi:hypothetical protein
MMTSQYFACIAAHAATAEIEFVRGDRLDRVANALEVRLGDPIGELGEPR